MKIILFRSSQVLFYIISCSFLFVFIVSVLSFVEKYGGVNMPFVTMLGNESLHNAQINVPFINATFSYKFSYSILFMWAWLFFYALFFYTLKEFFKIFIRKSVFDKVSINKLKLFLQLNYIPILINLVIILYDYFFSSNGYNFEEEFIFIVFHVCIGLLVYLYLDVFKKAKVLQDENDLMI